MPFCWVEKYQSGVDAAGNNGIKIFYRTYGRGPVKVLMIIGLAGTHDSWGPQIKGLTGTLTPNDHDWPETDRSSADDENGVCSEGHVEVCALDNRGMGRSSVPKSKSEYTTRIMAKDAIAVMDHLGWGQAHVFGHSMGAMISCKLASMVPDRVLSLALLNVTGGGFECFPKTIHFVDIYGAPEQNFSKACNICLELRPIKLDRQTLSIAIRFLKAKTPEQRAAVDLDTHYTKEYLEELVGSETRREILYQEYVKGISATGMQSNYGFDGQINACWTHKISPMELESICSSKFLISVIHGRDDVIAQLRHARRLAERLHPFARMVELHGGHLVSHERTEEVNEALLELIRASESGIDPLEWTNLPQPSPGWIVTRISLFKRNPEGGSNKTLIFGIVEKLYLFLVYLFGLLVLAFEHLRRAIRSLKPVKVEATLT